MRLRTITGLLDHTAMHNHVVLVLSCGHEIRVSLRELQVDGALGARLAYAANHSGTQWECEECEDLPAERSALQLWRAAGEP